MTSYGVPTKKGPVVSLDAHPGEVALRHLRSGLKGEVRPIAVDLFCGGGGMSLGLTRAGFKVVLGVDNYPRAVETHRAHFGGCSLRGDLARGEVLGEIVEALDGLKVSLLAGGPPCQPFSRAGRSKIRSLISGGVWEDDDRTDLWASFAYLAECLRPSTILLENVPDFGLGEKSMGFRLLVETLEEEGYRVSARILVSSKFGVPQHRQRLFIVGVRQGEFQWPGELTEIVTVRDAISDLPPVTEGSSETVIAYEEPNSEFQRAMRRGMPDGSEGKVLDHIARHVRRDDLEAFKLMTPQTLYSDLPGHLQRYRSDIFKDKYKRLSWDQPSRTITAHLAKDGYWYIHPEQHRTLTVREAARLQTFPDWFRFAGSPSHAFRQIGEAVPPILSEALGKQILLCLEESRRFLARKESGEFRARTGGVVTSRLREWFDDLEPEEMFAPWRQSGSVWLQLLGMVLFDRSPKKTVGAYWTTFAERWAEPEDFLDDPMRMHALRAVGREGAGPTLVSIAEAVAGDRLLEGFNRFPGVSPERVDLAKALCGLGDRRPPVSAVVRVAERVMGEDTEGSRSAGEILVGRLLGSDQDGRGYGALLELSERVCLRRRPRCSRCPLEEVCEHGPRRAGRWKGADTETMGTVRG